MIDVALLVWGIAAFVALCFRLLLLGAEVFDLEKLIERKRNGLTRIESVQHVRTEALWALVAMILIAVGLLQVVAPAWRGVASRWLLVLMAVLMAAAPIWDWADRRRTLHLTIWEEAGPMGPMGPAGPRGKPGAVGPVGPQGEAAP
jgi:hypothetical protein